MEQREHKHLYAAYSVDFEQREHKHLYAAAIDLQHKQREHKHVYSAHVYAGIDQHGVEHVDHAASDQHHGEHDVYAAYLYARDQHHDDAAGDEFYRQHDRKHLIYPAHVYAGKQHGYDDGATCYRDDDGYERGKDLCSGQLYAEQQRGGDAFVGGPASGRGYGGNGIDGLHAACPRVDSVGFRAKWSDGTAGVWWSALGRKARLQYGHQYGARAGFDEPYGSASGL